MIRRTVALLTLLILVLPAASVWPLGVGNIELSSALNERLSARIALRSLEAGDIDSMKVTLGSADQFQRAGIERPYFLTQLKFDIVPTADGGFIRISSPAVVAEPFLNFLIEVNWPRGRVLREYTVLLDPPVYGAAIASTVRQSLPAVPPEPTPAVEGLTTPLAETTSTSGVMPAPAPVTSTRLAPVAGEYGPVAVNDTLWSLASRFRPDGGYSVQQTMLALLDANPEAFSHRNVNTLRAGSVLRIPTADEVGAISRAQALEEVKRQHGAWEEIRANLGTTPPPSAPEGTMEAAPVADTAAEAGTEAAGGSATPATTPAAPGAETESRLELVGAGSEAAGTVGAPEQATSLDELRNELSLALEEVEAGRQQTDELGTRLSDAEALIDDLRRLVELKDESIAALQQQLAATDAMPEPAGAMPTPEVVPALDGMPTPEVVPVPEVMPEPEPAEMEPAPTPAPVAEAPVEEAPAPVEVTPEPVVAPAPEAQPEKPKVPLPPPPPPTPTSFMDILTDVLPVDPILLAGGAGGLALLGGLFAVMRRRRRGAEESVESTDEPEGPEIGSLIERYAASTSPADEDETRLPPRKPTDTVVEGPFDEEQTVIAGDPQATVSRPVREEEDPLAEVNNYLAYEHFDQAEELVRRAIEQHPERHEYRVRLLDVLRQSRNLAGFAVAAATLREAVGDDSPLMEKATAWWSELAPGSEPFEAGDTTVIAEDDFTQTHVGMESDEIFDVTGTGDVTGTDDVSGSAVDFDLGFEMTGSGDTTVLESSAVEPGSAVDFDLGGEDQASNDLDFVLDDGDAGEQTLEAPAGDDLDFDLGISASTVPDDTAESGALADELDFDLSEESGEPPAAEQETVSTAADDFDPGDYGERAAATLAGRPPEADDDLSFDLDTGVEDELPGADDEFDLDLGAGGEDVATSEEPAPIAGDSEHPEVDSEAETLVAEVADLDLDLDDGAETTQSDDRGSADVDDLDLGLGDMDDSLRAGTREPADAEPRADETVTEGEPPTGPDTELDFDLGEERDTSEDETLEAAADELDFDLGGDAADDALAGVGNDLDLDLGAENLASPGAAAAGDELDFDLGGLGDDEADADGPVPDTVLDLDFGAATEGAGDGGESGANDLDFDLSGFDTPADEGADDADLLGFGEDDETREVAPPGDGAESPLDESVFDTVKLAADDIAAAGGGAAEDVAAFQAAEASKSDKRGDDANMVEDAIEKHDSELDFDISGDDDDEFEFDLDNVEGLSLDGEAEETDDKTLVLGRGAGGELDEAQTKLDLAQAYIDMGDGENARAILGEVMAEGSEAQIVEAKSLLGKL